MDRLIRGLTFASDRVTTCRQAKLERVSESGCKNVSLLPQWEAQQVACAFRRATLLNANVKRRKTLEQAVFDAVEREQMRLASDLHDGVCQEARGCRQGRTPS